DARGVARRDELAARDAPARRALTLAAGKDAQQASRRTARRRGKIIVANVDHPSAVADGETAQGDGVAGIELALRQASAPLGVRPWLAGGGPGGEKPRDG